MEMIELLIIGGLAVVVAVFLWVLLLAEDEAPDPLEESPAPAPSDKTHRARSAISGRFIPIRQALTAPWAAVIEQRKRNGRGQQQPPQL